MIRIFLATHHHARAILFTNSRTTLIKGARNLFVCLGTLLCTCSALFGQTPPPGFSSLTVGSNWNQPVGLTFSNSGRMFVWEKAGKVWMVENDTKPNAPLLDISEEVGDWRDHGLLGFALDPNFEANGFIYLLYVVDRHYLTKFGTPAYRSTSNEYYQATIGRLTRYQVDLNRTNSSIVPQSRTILLGESINTGIPILSSVHGVGSLVFGSDGTLLVSCGDGASAQSADAGSSSVTYYAQGLADGIISPQQNVGAFRVQQIDVLNGKVLRLDPVTGDGVPGNPYFEAGNRRSARSRVWALGLRNPFRMSRRPDTGSTLVADGNPGVFYIGDVGFSWWEEMNVLQTAKTNFGWPLSSTNDWKKMPCTTLPTRSIRTRLTRFTRPTAASKPSFSSISCCSRTIMPGLLRKPTPAMEARSLVTEAKYLCIPVR